MRKTRFLTPVFLLLSAATLLGQSIPMATLTGKVTSEGGPGLPGVTVTAESPNLQGKRDTSSGANGDYIFNLLPAGDYTVSFTLSGMQTVVQKIQLSAARTARADAELKPSSVKEAVVVSGDAGAPAAILEETQISANYKKGLLEKLPVARTLQAATLLAPGVNNNGPGGNDREVNTSIAISGAPSFENLFLVDGVVTNENIRGQSHQLFIEDAIQETTVQTGAISAEYGRFAGGVVNAITKSGSNLFSGSFRTTFTNDKWTANDPYNNGTGTLGRAPTVADSRVDTLNKTFEETLGGPVFRDRLWFFLAARQAKLTDSNTTRATAGTGSIDPTPIPYTHGTDEKRYEGKITGAITPQHNVIVSYIDIKNHETNNRFTTNILDLASATDRDLPNRLLAANYNGVISDKMFVEAQYSKKKFTFQGGGCPFSDIVAGTLLIDNSRNSARYHCATFSNDTPERRDNESWAAKTSYFLSTSRMGSHDFRLGYEHFKDLRFANNHQSGSDYRILGTSAIIRGTQVFPVFQTPGDSTTLQWNPIFEQTNGTDFNTDSVFLNDKISFSKHWNFNVGVRYDKNNGKDSRGFTVSDDSAISPRLAAQYDIRGDGKFVINAGYAQYVTQLADSIGDSSSPAGQPASIRWFYRGPCINCDPNAPTSSLMSQDDAIRAVFAWFNSIGGTNSTPTRDASIPGFNTRIIQGSLKSPNVKEFTVGFGTALGSRGVAKIDFIHRDWDDFYALRTDASTGLVGPNQFGQTLDLGLVENSNRFDRKYTAVQFQYSYRFAFPVFTGGTYTWSRLTGNFDSENAGSGPITANLQYPEYLAFQQAPLNSFGYLAGDQRHRAKVWAGYDMTTPFGNLTVTALESYDSGRAYDANQTIDVRPYVTNPGYAIPPSRTTYYFSSRGAFRTDDVTRTDLAVNLSVKLFKYVELFVRPELLNVFNEKAFTGGRLGTDSDITVLDRANPGSNPATAFQAFNPFNQTPVQGAPGGAGVNYALSPTFGQSIAAGGYQLPRTFRVSVGVRF
jgi:outer membrane receptor for ferrienterochelin and colicin